MNKPKHSGNHIIILPDTPPVKINGIIVPDEARKPTNTGKVISAPNFKEGDEVAFNYRTGYEVEHKGAKYLSIRSSYILATIKEGIMQAIHARVFVEPIKKHETLSDGGVVLLEDTVVATGRVINTGQGTSTEPMVLEVNDIVIYPKQAGTLIKGLLLLNQCDIMAIEDEQLVEEGND